MEASSLWLVPDLGWGHGISTTETPDGVITRRKTMSTQSFTFHCKFVRRVPDPVFYDEFQMERHFMFVPAARVPSGLPMDPNARVPNIRRSVYKEVRDSLKTPDGQFHLK